MEAKEAFERSEKIIEEMAGKVGEIRLVGMSLSGMPVPCLEFLVRPAVDVIVKQGGFFGEKEEVKVNRLNEWFEEVDRDEVSGWKLHFSLARDFVKVEMLGVAIGMRYLGLPVIFYLMPIKGEWGIAETILNNAPGEAARILNFARIRGYYVDGFRLHNHKTVCKERDNCSLIMALDSEMDLWHLLGLEWLEHRRRSVAALQKLEKDSLGLSEGARWP